MRKSLESLKKDLVFAAFVMRFLSPVRVQKCRSSWPRLIYTSEEVSAQKLQSYYYRPTPEEISRMERILDWYQCLNAFETKLVWKRSCNVSWKLLCVRFKHHRSTLYQKYQQALLKMQSFVNKM